MMLAVWRISNMLVHEWGPFGLLAGIRRLVGIRHDREGNVMTFSHRNVLSCVWCTSIWVALILALVSEVLPYSVLVVVYVMGLSAVASLIDMVHTKVGNVDEAPKVFVNNYVNGMKEDSK